MIPRLASNGLLPPGIHTATLQEVKAKFGMSTSRREKLYVGLVKAINNLRKAGVKTVYINGSFVTFEPEPNDIDGCWDPAGVNSKHLDSVFLDFSKKRKKMKEKYGVDFFIANQMEGGSALTFQDFFQVSRDGVSKGIIRINLD